MQVLNSSNTNTDVLAVLQALASDPEAVKARLDAIQVATEKNQKILAELNEKLVEVQKGERKNKVDAKAFEDNQAKVLAEKEAFEVSKQDVMKALSEQESLIAKREADVAELSKSNKALALDLKDKTAKAENTLALAQKMMQEAEEKAAAADALYQRLTKALAG
jgi:hypothetical protein